MSTSTSTLTAAQARRYGRWLVDNGYSNVRVVEQIDRLGSTLRVAYDNRCGMPRVIESLADFIVVRDS